jgi:hypothetical protein
MIMTCLGAKRSRLFLSSGKPGTCVHKAREPPVIAVQECTPSTTSNFLRKKRIEVQLVLLTSAMEMMPSPWGPRPSSISSPRSLSLSCARRRPQQSRETTRRQMTPGELTPPRRLRRTRVNSAEGKAYLEVGEGDGDRADGRRPLHRAAPDRACRGGGGDGDGGSAPGSPASRGWSPSGLCPHGAAHLHDARVLDLDVAPSCYVGFVWGDLFLAARCRNPEMVGLEWTGCRGEVEPSRARCPGGAARLSLALLGS